MELTPITRKEHFLAKAAGDENALELQPVTREEHFLQNIIDAIEEGGGGGGPVTPESIVTATGQMTSEQAEDTLENIGGQREMLIVAITEESGVYSSNKTYAQIHAAMTERLVLFAVLESGFQTTVTANVEESSNTITAVGLSKNMATGESNVCTVRITSQNVVSVTRKQLAEAPIYLNATPTAGPSGTTLMSGTWSGATWEEVAAAVLASRLIQIDVATIGKITLLYNLGSATSAASNAFIYNVGGVLYNVIAELFFDAGNNWFELTIINARTKTENVIVPDPTITPAANTIYNCGELTSLTISNPTATGGYSIVFTSGSTATTTTIPATILGLESFAAEANTLYEINVLDNRAVVGSWAVPAAE